MLRYLIYMSLRLNKLNKSVNDEIIATHVLLFATSMKTFYNKQFYNQNQHAKCLAILILAINK